jgi:hypothetical protein
MTRHRSRPHAIAAITSLLVAVLWATAVDAQPRQQVPRQGHHDGDSSHERRVRADRHGHGRASNELVAAVRAATARFHDVAVAEAEGYAPMFGCVSGPDWGAMGLHYVNLTLVADGVLDPSRPEIVIYEPLPNGRLRLVGADFLVFAEDWHATTTGTPQIGGQLLHLFESPNRYGLPDFYTLHVWAWKENAAGTFSNWHADVSCDEYR